MSETSEQTTPYKTPRHRNAGPFLVVGFLVLLLVAALIYQNVSRSQAAAPSRPAPTVAVSSAPAIQAHRLTKCFADRLTEMDAQQRLSYLALMKAAGATCVRTDIEWRAVEKAMPENGIGQYDFSDFDEVVRAIHAAGLEPHLILDYAPWWAAGRTSSESCMGGEICSPTATAAKAFGDFARATGQHYGQAEFGNVQVFEIWNEPNIEQYWPKVDPQLYLEFFVAAKHGLRQANPNAIVVTGGLAVAGDHAMLPVDFLNGMYAAGLHQYLDSATKIGFHPYTNGALPGQDDAQDGWGQMILGHEVLTANGDDTIGFRITEIGWSTTELSPADQARLAAEMFRLLGTPEYKWVEVVTWYTYRDNDKYMGLVTSNGAAKPSLVVFTKAA